MPSPEGMRLTTLRLVPLMSATAVGMMAWCETYTLLPFLHPEMPSQAASVWWKRSFNSGLGTILTLGLTTAATGYIAWRDSIGTTRKLFGWGTVFASAHFLYGYSISQVIKRCVYGPTEPKDEIRNWLKIHFVRTFTSDIPAIICFLGAFVHLAEVE